MRPFLLASVAFGLLSPLTAFAGELNLGAVNRYAGGSRAAQVSSISQFSDLRPTDWAYQALSSLIQRYGCVAGYPNGSFKGGQTITRYEAAALLNACVDRISEVTDELRRLMVEFDRELALLRGPVDGLEARVGELEATRFTTMTRLRGDTRWVLGGLNFSGNQVNGNNTYGPPGRERPLRDALTFNFDTRLNFDTSFRGKDLLRAQLRAGDFADSPFGNLDQVTMLTQLDVAFEENCGAGFDCGGVFSINRLYYRFPVGADVTAFVGSRMRQDDALAVKPSVYTADKILKLWDFNGAPGAYSQLLGTGAGLWWRQPGKGGLSFGGVYVSANADYGSPQGEGCRGYSIEGCGGIGSAAGRQTGSLQLAYTGGNWSLAGIYTYNSGGVPIAGTPLSRNLLPNIYNGIGSGRVNSWGISGYWQPLRNGWFPSVSSGWGYNSYSYGGTVAADPARLILEGAASQSWYVGLNWRDLFAKGNALGFALGQPTFVTAARSIAAGDLDVADGNYAFELYYKFQLTDNIAVTPSLFWLSRARGQLTNSNASTNAALLDQGISNGDSLGTFGGLIQSTIRF